MKDIWVQIEAKKKIYDRLKPFPKELVKQMEEWLRVELTYSSNAIEGNTLSRLETAEVMEKGVDAILSGKPLRDQLEARNHQQALNYIDELMKIRKGHQFITEGDIKNIHKIFLGKIDDNNAGIYRRVDVFIRGSDVEFPAPRHVPHHMAKFVKWLQNQQEGHPVQIAADAHFKFVSIHPFIDGNGRTARLLMNLILNLNGYPSAIIRPEDRTAYLQSIYEAQKGKSMEKFYQVIGKTVLRSLDLWISGKPFIAPVPNVAVGEVGKAGIQTSKLLKIGELAKETGETIHTLRFWVKSGLIKPKEFSAGGYQLFEKSVMNRIKQIRKLQKEKRLTIEEIKKLSS